MTDIYVLYKNDENKENVSAYVQKIKEKIDDGDARGSYISKRAYIPEDIEKSLSECTDSTTLLVFFDREIIYDDSCLQIWDAFFKRQQAQQEQIIFPVKLKQPELLPGEDNKDRIAMFACANKLGFFDLFSGETDTLRQDEEFGKLASAICDSLGKTENNRRPEAGENVHQQDEGDEGIDKIFETKVPTEKARKIAELKDKAEAYENHNAPKQPICAIYTGGTVGMVREQKKDLTAVQVPADLEKLVKNLPRLRDLNVDIHFYTYETKVDSSNIESKDWMVLAEIIETLRDIYQGFVIIHGANTMAYTASALSFMLEDIGMPVILTGSELSLTDLNSDAEQNVIRALDAAAHVANRDMKIKEVCILFGRRLIRGNRATKQISLDTAEGFYSPNYDDLASVTQEKLSVDFGKLRMPRGTFKNNRQMSSDKVILICDVYPDMDMGLFETVCRYSNLDALIIRTYGTGGAPDKNARFINCLRELIENHKIVINLTQCPIGSVELRLFETNATLFDIGVVNGGDMVTEAAYCKLKHLYAKYSEIRDIAQRNQFIINNMTVDLRGELTLSTFVVRFYKRTNTGNDVDDGYICERDDWRVSLECGIDPELISLAQISDNTPLCSAIMRIEKLEICPDAENDTDVPLEIEIEKYVSDADSKLLGFDKRFFEADDEAASIDINIDITNTAKQLIELTKKFKLRIKSCRHKIKFQALSIIFSVREN